MTLSLPPPKKIWTANSHLHYKLVCCKNVFPHLCLLFVWTKMWWLSFLAGLFFPICFLVKGSIGKRLSWGTLKWTQLKWEKSFSNWDWLKDTSRKDRLVCECAVFCRADKDAQMVIIKHPNRQDKGFVKYGFLKVLPKDAWVCSKMGVCSTLWLPQRKHACVVRSLPVSVKITKV